MFADSKRPQLTSFIEFLWRGHSEHTESPQSVLRIHIELVKDDVGSGSGKVRMKIMNPRDELLLTRVVHGGRYHDTQQIDILLVRPAAADASLKVAAKAGMFVVQRSQTFFWQPPVSKSWRPVMAGTSAD